MKRMMAIFVALVIAVLIAPAPRATGDDGGACVVGQLRAAAKYTRCRLNAEVAALRRGKEANLERCELKFGQALSQLSGCDDPSTEQTAAIQSSVEERAGGIAAVVKAPGLLAVEDRRVARFGPVHMTAEQDLILGAFIPESVRPGLSGDKEPPYNVILRVYDDAGGLIAESIETTVAGVGVSLRIPGAEIFGHTEPCFITGEVRLVTDPHFVGGDASPSQDKDPPWHPSLQLIDAATNRLDLFLEQSPPYHPGATAPLQRMPSYLSPLHVTADDNLLLAYSGVGGETIRFRLLDEAGTERYVTEPLLVPSVGGGIDIELDGQTVVQGDAPDFLVGVLEVIDPAAGKEPPWRPARFSFGVLHPASGKTVGVAAASSIWAETDPPWRPDDPEPPWCDPYCEPPN